MNWFDTLWSKRWLPFALVLVGAAILWVLGYRDADASRDATFAMAMLVIAVGALAPIIIRQFRAGRAKR